MAMNATDTARDEMTTAALDCGHEQLVALDDTHAWCTRCAGTTEIEHRPEG